MPSEGAQATRSTMPIAPSVGKLAQIKSANARLAIVAKSATARACLPEKSATAAPARGRTVRSVNIGNPVVNAFMAGCSRSEWQPVPRRQAPGFEDSFARGRFGCSRAGRHPSRSPRSLYRRYRQPRWCRGSDSIAPISQRARLRLRPRHPRRGDRASRQRVPTTSRRQ